MYIIYLNNFSNLFNKVAYELIAGLGHIPNTVNKTKDVDHFKLLKQA